MKQPENNSRGNAAAIVAAAVANGIFGFSFMFSRIALQITTPQTLLMLRFCMAFLLIAVLAGFFSRRDDAPSWLRFQLKGKPVMPLIALGFMQPVLYFLCESNGVNMTNATVSGVIIALIPIIAMAFGRVFLKEKVRPVQTAFALISIVGVIMMTVGQSAGGTIQPLGVLLLMGAAVSAAVFNITSRRLSASYSPLESTFVMMGVGAVVFTVIALVRGADLSVVTDIRLLGSLLYLAVLSSIAAFLLLNFANSRLPVAKATAFANLTTVLSMFAGVVFLGEPFNALSLAAAVMIVVGIAGVQKAG